ncbi:MAG: hypothetical protein IJS37_03535 [Bacilli bacterium]|nr:hypothetical protein [Bacilli bacterium]
MNLLGEYRSVAEAAKATGVAKANICHAGKQNYCKLSEKVPVHILHAYLQLQRILEWLAA